MKAKKKVLVYAVSFVIVISLLLIIKWKDDDSRRDQEVANSKETEVNTEKKEDVKTEMEEEVDTDMKEEVCTIAKDIDKIDFVQKMGNGINIGNSLDATKHELSMYELATETCWGNPRITPELLKAVHEAGFETVRIPITFDGHMNQENQISEAWMERVEEVINAALDEGLYVIMDTHHEDWLDLKIDQKEQITKKFEAVWAQLALRFRDYDEHLLFEGMNEPRLRKSTYEWTEGTPELRDFVNELNRIFVDTVRKSGGNNKERFLLVSPYCNQPRKATIEEFPVPDGNVIVAVHMYHPYQFSQKQDGTSQWSADNPADTDRIDDSFERLYNTFIKQGIPVIFTEYGCVDKNNLEERVAFGSYYNQKSKQYQIPIIWWDNGKQFNLIHRSSYKVVYPEIVEAIR